MVVVQSPTTEERLRQKLAGISNLPTPPLVFSQIQKLISAPDSSVNEIAAVLSEDAAMSAKVLRLSNSAFYAIRGEITSIRQAVMVLGLEAIRSLVLSSSVFDMFRKQALDQEFQENYWRHSLATALACRLIVRFHRSARGLDAELAFSAGLLHDIGKLIICCFFPKDYGQIREYKQRLNSSDYQAETAILGYTHSLVGKLLTEMWRLPATIVSAIEHHHSPNNEVQEHTNYARIVHIANYLAHRTFNLRMPEHPGWSYLESTVQTELELTDEIIDAFCQQLRDEYSHSSTFMQMAISD